MVSQRTGLKAMRMPTGCTHLPAACNDAQTCFCLGLQAESRYAWRTNRRAIAAQTSGAMTGGRQLSHELGWKPRDVLRAKNSPNGSSSWTPIWAAQRLRNAFPELGLGGFAVHQVYAAITCRLERNLAIQEMRREVGEWAVGLSRFGVAARAVVFALLGWTVVIAGWSRDASEVGTTTSSLRTLAEQPGALGRWLVG